ncbi:peroxiredoxin family protein [Pseudalkalibacillus caeni]|uniref:peroxiredoxin family protein n=1 Tax=Exobacillus caeni TaxID=2574798 RepID=UPI001FE5D5CF|nr:TlpA disulfide reductase family protein [Pseudalkalibacillus caeni]
MRKIFPFAIIAILAIVLLLEISGIPMNNSTINNDAIKGYSLSDSNGAGIKEGSKAPDFSLQTIDGKKVKLSDYRGKKVVLNFWATWCPPCKKELPELQEYYIENGNDKVEIIGVNLTKIERSEKDVDPFVEKYGLTFPVILDKKGKVEKVYQIQSYPTSYILDKDGNVEKVIAGAVNKETLENILSLR